MAEDGKVIYKIEGDDSKALKVVEHFERAAKDSGKDVETSAKKSSKNVEDAVKDSAKKSEDAIKKSAKGSEGSILQSAKKVAVAIGVAGLAKKAVGFAIDFGKASAMVASDLEEVQNVVDTTFGTASSIRINEWARNAAEMFGESELQAKQFTSTLGAMFKSMGVGQKELEDMSISLAGLAGDMASFYNLDPSEAFEKLRAGISGETEPLKQLGINMSVANLEAFALAQGIDKAYNAMTQAEQATLRYNYIMSATADAQGDFAKTSDSLANQMRIMSLEVETLKAEIGQGLMPVAQKMVEWGRGAVGWFTEHASGISDFAKTLIESFSPFVERLLPSAAALLEVIAPILAPIVELFGTLGGVIAEKLAAAIDFLTPIVEAIVKAFNGWMEIVSAVYEEAIKFAEAVSEELAPVFEIFGGVVEKVLDLLESVWDLIGGIIGRFVEWVSESETLREILDILGQLFEKVVLPFLENLGAAIERDIGRLESFIEKIKDVLQWLGILEKDKTPLNRRGVTQQDIIKNGVYHMEYDTDENGAPTNGHMVVDWDKAEQMHQDGTWVGGGQVTFGGGGRRHQSGEDFVMADWTPAYLDYGERVLTASENARYTAMGGVDGMERTAAAPASGGFSGPSKMELGLKVSPREMAHAITPYIIRELQAQGQWEDVR